MLVPAGKRRVFRYDAAACGAIGSRITAERALLFRGDVRRRTWRARLFTPDDERERAAIVFRIRRSGELQDGVLAGRT